MAPLNQVIEQVKAFWSGMSPRQRVLLIAGAVLTVAVLGVFTSVLATPEYKPLYTGMEPEDVQELTSRLQAKNIRFQIGPDGKTVNVPAEQLDASRMELATEGMPRSGRLGFELFDKLTWGQTEFDEKVNYQRALEGELERTIQTLKGVKSARVHLVMPTQSVFIDRERESKASVILTLKGGRMSEETQQGIARLVAGAVDGLTPENVTVIDGQTNRPLGLPRDNGVFANSQLDRQLADKVVATLAPVVGADRIRASVNVEFDPTTAEEDRETYDPQSVVAVSMQRTEEQINGERSGGVPGTSSNVPTSANQKRITSSTPAAEPTQLSKSENGTYVVNRVTRHLVQPAGRIRRISAAVLVDDAREVQQSGGQAKEVRRKRSPEEIKTLEDLAKGALGIDMSRGDSITVQSLAFEEPENEVPSRPSTVQRIRTTLNDWSSVVRYASLLLLFLFTYWLLIRPIKKQVMRSPKPALQPVRTEALSQAQEEVIGTPALPENQKRTVTLKKQLVAKVKADPPTASRLVQAWLREDEL